MLQTVLLLFLHESFIFFCMTSICQQNRNCVVYLLTVIMLHMFFAVVGWQVVSKNN